MARAFRLKETETEKKNGSELKISQGHVEFRDVHFHYTPEREVLKGISLTLTPGKVTAIVGTSGAGKTTLVDLMMKLYEPTQGGIFIDGECLATCDAASVRRHIGMVSADGAIFRGTLADNIRYKRPEASEAEVRAAALSAGMEGTVQRLPEGLNTPVGENGIGLSVGERQRIQIARILVSQPKILVLDEATANLDYATENEIKQTINKIRKENTVVIIAHRYSMIKDADYAIVLSAGEVTEAGPPKDLISAGGWFSRFSVSADIADPGNSEVSDEGDADDETDEVEDEN
jgi:ABC-type multidrug transport system fused ATPase/permease subunit